MSFQDVAFLSSQASFSTTFLKNCGSGECLWTTTCLKTMVEGKQGHACCKILSLHEAPFCVNQILWRLYNCLQR